MHASPHSEKRCSGRREEKRETRRRRSKTRTLVSRDQRLLLPEPLPLLPVLPPLRVLPPADLLPLLGALLPLFFVVDDFSLSRLFPPWDLLVGMRILQCRLVPRERHGIASKLRAIPSPTTPSTTAPVANGAPRSLDRLRVLARQPWPVGAWLIGSSALSLWRSQGPCDPDRQAPAPVVCCLHPAGLSAGPFADHGAAPRRPPCVAFS